MKRSKKKLVYLLLEILFIGVVPLVLIFTQYGQIGSTRVKLSLTGILLVLFVFLVLKRVVLRKYFANLQGRIVNYETGIRTETDEGKLANLERELKNAWTVETIWRAITPAICLVLAFLACKAMETQLVKLSGTLGFIGLSFLVGTVFSVLSAREVRSRNRKKQEEVKK